ncbi:MAG: hypothetical protein COA91_08940 [Robiginitomaculum sp.]|nr:MAG: hypothetical protein COA91_08940 [Robiginitomaculum sp.]
MSRIATQNPSQAGTISKLYERWIELSKILTIDSAKSVQNENQMQRLETKINRHIDEQIRIVAYLCEIPAKTASEVLMKLSIWRRSHGDNKPEEDFASRSEYIAYCAYRDLLSLTDNWNLATDNDKQFLVK